jgi:hypothetical protein
MENAGAIRFLIAPKLDLAPTRRDGTCVGSQVSLMIFKRVDLPAPFSPTSPTTSPSLRYRVTSVSAGFPAKALLIPLRSMMRRTEAS